MTKEEYLKQVGKLQHKLNMMKLRAEEYEALANSIPSQDFTRERVDCTRNLEAPFVKWLIKLMDLEAEMKEVEKQLDEKRAEVITVIEALSDENQKSVLMLRYISLLSFNQITEKMFYSLSTIKRWHKEGIELIKVDVKKWTIMNHDGPS